MGFYSITQPEVRSEENHDFSVFSIMVTWNISGIGSDEVNYGCSK